MSLTSPGAGGTLSYPSKSSREFKHKPICERIFCLSVFHFSLGIPSQTSGVLLASKLAYVSISLPDRLSTIKGGDVFAFIYPAGRNGGSCVIPVCNISHTHMGWGGGEAGNYSNI